MQCTVVGCKPPSLQMRPNRVSAAWPGPDGSRAWRVGSSYSRLCSLFVLRCCSQEAGLHFALYIPYLVWKVPRLGRDLDETLLSHSIWPDPTPPPSRPSCFHAEHCGGEQRDFRRRPRIWTRPETLTGFLLHLSLTFTFLRRHRASCAARVAPFPADPLSLSPPESKKPEKYGEEEPPHSVGGERRGLKSSHPSALVRPDWRKAEPGQTFST